MVRTSATFFDGVSSTPQVIELKFDELTGIFTFETSSNQLFKWAVEDTSTEQTGTTLNIHLGDNAIQFIKVNNAEFTTKLNEYLKTNGHVSWYQKLINLGMKAHIAIAIFILGLIVLVYMFIIPWVGEKAVIIIPTDYDNEIGNTFFTEYSKYNSIDTIKTKALNDFAKQLNLRNSKKIAFTVIQSSTVNAFALPDGNIIVYTGIIKEMKEYDELVALIGHEVVHVNNRHSMKMMCRNLSGYIFISAILSDVNGIMAIIGDNVRNLQSLSYSRQFEREADTEGLDIMVENKVNPKGMTNLFKRLQSKSDLLLPEFLSSHPITKERQLYIDKLIKSTSYRTTENSELKRIFSVLQK
jgi:predicted Zn-dependent protease